MAPPDERRTMKLDFAKNTKRNIIAAVFNKGIGLVFPFLNRTLFLWLLGPEYLGLNGLFGSILGVLSLAELGFSKAIICSMYKPIAEDNRELLCAYLRFYRTVYRWVGSGIFAVGLCLLPFIRQLIHGNVPPDIDVHILYLIHLVNTSISYFLFAYRGAVLNAHHRGDVVTNFQTVTSILQYISVFLVLLITRNYYYYVLITVVFTVLNNFLTVYQARRLFPDIKPAGRLPDACRRQVAADVKSIFMHKVGAVISYSLDNVIISAFLGLATVAVYGNYYYVVEKIGGFAAIIGNALHGGFGNKIYTETKETNFRLFMKMNRLALVGVLWFAAMIAALYQPFIEIWTKHDATLMRHALTPILMLVFFYVTQTRHVLLTFKSAAALWKQDRLKPLVAGGVNLGLNIMFVIYLPDSYKLDGVILSTIIGFVLIQIPWESYVLFTAFFNGRQAREYWLLQARFATLALALCGASWGIAEAIPIEGVAGFFVKGVAAALVSSALLLSLFRKDALEALMALRGKHRA